MAGRNGADAVLSADDDGSANVPGGADHRWGGAIRLAGVLVILSLLGACSAVPSSLDPTTWYGPSTKQAARAGQEGTPKNQLQADRGKAPPGANGSYPNLSQVDQQAAARDDMKDGLVADAQAPKYAAAVPRQGESSPPPMPPKPSPTPTVISPPTKSMTQTVLPATPVPQQSAQQGASMTASSASSASGTQGAESQTGEAQGSQTETQAAGMQQSASMPIAEPKPETEITQNEMPTGGSSEMASATPSTSTSSSSTSNANTGGLDQSAMADSLKKQLADIRSRAADQGSLMTTELQQSSGGGLSTVVVSSNGVETQGGGAQGGMAVPGAEPMSSGGHYVENHGALPLPPDAVHVATIQFGRGNARLSSRDRRILADVKRLQQERGGHIRVVGHASQWTRNMTFAQHQRVNFRVSKARANRVATELVRLGVPRGDVLTAAVGDSDPRYFEVMPSGEAGNRRTEIYLTN